MLNKLELRRLAKEELIQALDLSLGDTVAFIGEEGLDSLNLSPEEFKVFSNELNLQIERVISRLQKEIEE